MVTIGTQISQVEHQGEKKGAMAMESFLWRGSLQSHVGKLALLALHSKQFPSVISQDLHWFKHLVQILVSGLSK